MYAALRKSFGRRFGFSVTGARTKLCLLGKCHAPESGETPSLLFLLCSPVMFSAWLSQTAPSSMPLQTAANPCQQYFVPSVSEPGNAGRLSGKHVSCFGKIATMFPPKCTCGYIPQSIAGDSYWRVSPSLYIANKLDEDVQSTKKQSSVQDVWYIEEAPSFFPLLSAVSFVRTPIV